MKKLLFSICIISLAALATHCDSPAKKTESPKPLFNYSDQLLEEFCNTPLDEYSGDSITAADAKIKLDSFKNHLMNDGHDIKQALYGFYFGKEELKEFVKKLNKGSSNPNDPKAIIGARVYLILSKNQANQMYQDVMLIPVTRDGMNVLPIDTPRIDPIIFKIDSSMVDPKPVLNTSTPCPNQC